MLEGYSTGGEQTLEDDLLRRISLFVRIWLGLNCLFQSEDDVIRWLRSPNDAFDGESPLQRMVGGVDADLVSVLGEVSAAEKFD